MMVFHTLHYYLFFCIEMYSDHNMMDYDLYSIHHLSYRLWIDIITEVMYSICNKYKNHFMK